MPHQFGNLPNKPISAEDSRQRLQRLVNQSKTDGVKSSSRLIQRLSSSVESPRRVASEPEKVIALPPVRGSAALQRSVVNAAKEKSAEDTWQSEPISSARYLSGIWQQYVHQGRVSGPQEDKVILEVTLPQENEVEAAAAEQLYAGLSNTGEKPSGAFELLVGMLPQLEILFKNPNTALSFEIIADEKEIRFWVVVPKQWANFVEKIIHGAYADAEIEPAVGVQMIAPEGEIQFAELDLKGKVYYPVRMLDEFESDPLGAITSIMSKLDVGERLVLQILVQPADDLWRQRGQLFLQRAQAPPKDEKERKVFVAPAVIEAVTKKVSRPGFRVVVRVLAQAQDAFKAKNILGNMVNAFDQYSLPHLAVFKAKRGKLDKNQVESFVTRSFPRWGNYPILNTTELATIYHFPGKDVKTPRIKWLRSRRSAPPTNLPKEGLYLGVNDYRNQKTQVRIARDDRRRHMYVIGQTGSGKSEFLKYMAYQDIKNGDGLAFIDPHGEAVEDLLKSIPKERAEDVIYFNPGDTERPIGLNILDVKSEEGKHQTVNSFISLLYKLYDPNHTGMVGAQLERAVRNVMLTAMSEEGNTMVEVLRLLTNPKFAEKKIPLIQDPLVKAYWTEQIAQTSEVHRSETLGYFVSKFDRFVTEKLMRNIIGQSHSAFDFRQIMDQKKILLINLSKGKIGEENSNFLGLILVPRILAAAMSRADMPKEERKDFFLYVDEFQNFSTPDFAQILAEARKYRLNLIVANQYIAQIQDDIRNAVFGNVGTMVSFRIGADDAEYMEKQYEPVFSQKDLINLAIGEGATRVLVEGQPSRPFSFMTDWPAMQKIPQNQQIADVIKEMSRLKYGRDRAVVEREVAVRAGFNEQ